MAERYTRLKELVFPEQPAACPVTIDKGALLSINKLKITQIKCLTFLRSQVIITPADEQ